MLTSCSYTWRQSVLKPQVLDEVVLRGLLPQGALKLKPQRLPLQDSKSMIPSSDGCGAGEREDVHPWQVVGRAEVQEARKLAILVKTSYGRLQGHSRTSGCTLTGSTPARRGSLCAHLL